MIKYQNALHCGASLSKQWRVSLIAGMEYGISTTPEASLQEHDCSVSTTLLTYVVKRGCETAEIHEYIVFSDFSQCGYHYSQI